MSKVLPAGAIAPNFKLRATPEQNLSLSDFAGQAVVLAFYPADGGPVCGDQMVPAVADPHAGVYCRHLRDG